MAQESMKRTFSHWESTLDVLASLGRPSDQKRLVDAVQGIAEAAKSFAFVGSLVSPLEAFQPSSKHEEVMRALSRLQRSISHASDAVQHLEAQLRWHATKIQYADVVSRIDTGMMLLQQIWKSKDDKNKRNRFKDRLVQFAGDQNLLVSLNVLLDGVTGEGSGFQTDILDSLYIKTGGDMSKIATLAGRLLQLLAGGLITLMAYESIERGEAGAQDMVPIFQERLGQVEQCLERALQRCKVQFRTNIEYDLERSIEDNVHKSNEELVDDIFNLLHVKYDWLHMYVQLYNDVGGFENHCYSGPRVQKTHFNGKCVLVFYIKKTRSFRGADSMEMVRWHVEKHAQGARHAECLHDEIRDELDARKLGHWGIAVIKTGTDLHCRTSVQPERVIAHNASHYHVLVLME